MKNEKKIPKWVEDKHKANQPIEDVIFIGEMGASGVIDGKLPNGEVYEWSKKTRKRRRRKIN